MGEIRKDNLHESLIEELNKLANIDLSGKQDKTDESLLTESKDVIGAINELFQSANNGKELIANAIGEPLDSNDTFSAMSNDINSLLSTFKTNMMNNGVTVESSDRFKQLIDKIATLADNEGKGVQFASGTVLPSEIKTGSFTYYSTNTSYNGTNMYYLTINDLKFTPSVILITGSHVYRSETRMTYGVFDIINNMPYYVICGGGNLNLADAKNLSGTIKGAGCYDMTVSNSMDFPLGFALNNSYPPTLNNFTWYAFGVGEEDTTLRDSLASILEEEGVTTTDEDDMASLIGKVDEEFSENKQELVDVLVSKGVECSTNNSFDELIANINNIGGIQTSPTSFNDALYYNGDSADITNNLTCCTYTSKFNGTIRVLVRVSSNYGSGATITATYYKNNNKVGSSSCNVSYNSPEFGKDCVCDIDVEKNDVITVVLTYSGDGPKYHHTVILASF